MEQTIKERMKIGFFRKKERAPIFVGYKMVTVSILLSNAIDRIRQSFLSHNIYLKF